VPSLPLPHPALEADGVRLRPWSAADLPAAHAAVQDPAVSRYTRVPVQQSRADLSNFIAAHERRREEGTSLDLAVARIDDDAFLGARAIVRVDWFDARAELGYWLAAGARGRGVATVALRLLSDWALTALPLARLELVIAAANTGSLAVAERAGYVREATLRSYLATAHGRDDGVVFRRLREPGPRP
jgi:RimJ/RimL family protein N-acetyltransferase